MEKGKKEKKQPSKMNRKQVVAVEELNKAVIECERAGLKVEVKVK